MRKCGWESGRYSSIQSGSVGRQKVSLHASQEVWGGRRYPSMPSNCRGHRLPPQQRHHIVCGLSESGGPTSEDLAWMEARRWAAKALAGSVSLRFALYLSDIPSAR